MELDTVTCADCREWLPTLPDGSVDAIITDPPYGVAERTMRRTNRRGKACSGNDFPPIIGDDRPFDPTHLLVFPRLVLWGANYFAQVLPRSSSWLVWDKRDGVSSDDNADCEIAWSNLGGPARIFRHLWKGMIKASERNCRRVHPTQKPVALMKWVIERCQLEPGSVICDPYCGSGTTLVAAKDMGMRFLGCELDPHYCDVARRRVARAGMPLFAEASHE